MRIIRNTIALYTSFGQSQKAYFFQDGYLRTA